jgi:hypothetical protein
LLEPSDASCQQATASLADERANARAAHDAEMLAWNGLDGELLARVCRAAGRYVWHNGKLVRDKPAPAGISAP